MELCLKENCTGCLACYNACNNKALKVKQDEEGFTYPYIDAEHCTNCGLCSQVCPELSSNERERMDPIEVYAAWNKDYEVVRKSSSGGFFTVVAKWFLSNSGSVYGAAFEADFNVNHIRVTDEAGLQLLVGSKYVQSNVGITFKQVKSDLKKGKWVLYCGTPCQITGLNNYLGNKCDRQKLFTIDLVCHGVPTPTMFHEYKKYLEKQYKSKIISYSFRDKKWSWAHYNTKAVFENGKVYYGKWEEDVFMRGFLREYYLRPSCHHCRYSNTKRPGDFSIADFWCYSNPRGEERNRDRGVNAILVNTQKAKSFYMEIAADLYSYQKPLSEPVKTNRALRACFPASPRRKQFWLDYKQNGFEQIIDKYLYPSPINSDLSVLYSFGKWSYKVYLAFMTILKRIIG